MKDCCGSMTNAEINEIMAVEIKDMLLKYDIFHGTYIYFNGKCLYDANKGEIKLNENAKVEDFLKYYNSEMVSLSYEGMDSLYLLINGYAYEEADKAKANKVYAELTAIGDKYNRWFDLGDDTTLYFKSKDEEDKEFDAWLKNSKEESQE